MKTIISKIFLLFAFAVCTTAAYAQLSVSLSFSGYNGYNVSCFGGTNGWITATPSGGTSPYTYLWSNSATTQTINNVAANYYVVTVTDAVSNTATAGVTMREPTQLTVTATKSSYPNGYNVSCYQCFNGSITITPSGGVASYSFLWSDGPTTQNRSSIGGGNYVVTVTDANSCIKAAEVSMAEPTRDDWTMLGNTGSNPSTHYIGTADNIDFVFRTNATERLRVKSNGYVGIGTNNPTKILDVNGDARFSGEIRAGAIQLIGVPRISTCIDLVGLDSDSNLIAYDVTACLSTQLPFWTTSGNTLGSTTQFIGTLDNKDFRIKTNNIERMVVKADGKVGIGISTVPTGYLLAVKGNIIAEEVKVKLHSAGWPDYVFENGYAPMPLKELERFVTTHKHLPEIPSAKEVETNEGVEVGDMVAKLLKKNEEQTLYIIDLNKKIEALELKVKALSSER